MPMSREQFEALVKSLEIPARKDPRGYQFRVGLLAALGYAYIFVAVALLLALLGGLVWVVVTQRHANFGIVKIALVAGALLLLVVRALWVRIPPPEGLELKREEAPRLFEMVDGISDALQAPRFHHILIDGDFNAAVVQHARLGVLGWHKNYLLLGLPLMQAVSPEQFRAIVAHELGHLSGSHSRFAGWIYRIRLTWYQLMEAFDTSGQWGSFLFERFFHWYVPYFNAYSFVLARSNEYVADRCSAEVAGAKTMAEALIVTEVKGSYLARKIWPGVYERANVEPEPPASALTAVAASLRTRLPENDASGWLREALLAETGYSDTHPSLTDRLAALGCLPDSLPDSAGRTPPLPPAVEASAADEYLGASTAEIAARLDALWRESIQETWAARYDYARETRKQLEALEEKARHGPLTEEEAWNRARWTLEFSDDEAAIPLLRELLAAYPGHVGARYQLGRALLEKGEEEGIGHLEAAMEKDPALVLEGCGFIYAFLRREGRSEEAEGYRQRATGHMDRLDEAQAERARFGPKDEYLPHGLPEEELQKIRVQLERYESIREAFLVRKAVKQFEEYPVYLLGISTDAKWYKYTSETDAARLVQQLVGEMDFPGETFVVILTGEYGWLKTVMRNTEGAQIYPA
ncbi:MAG: M48 family metalloprotease [Armatimonadetes bacterium]|nr:M48 family metalloprotease [Armatimonadota bacterium]